MKLNISVAKHLCKCVVSEAWSSLAWWLQPRWVVEAPAQDQSRSWQGDLSRIASMKYIIWILCLRPKQLWVGVPRNNSFGKQLPRVVSSLVFGEVREVWDSGFFGGSMSNARRFVSSRCPVFQVYCHAFLLTKDEVTLSNWLGFTQFIWFNGHLISWNFIIFLSNISMIESPQGPDVHRHGTLDRLGFSES